MQAKTDTRLVWAVQLVLRVFLLFVTLQSISLSAQCTLSCPSGLNLSIAGPDFGCSSVLTPIDIGVVAPSCSGILDLDLFTSSNQLIPGGTTPLGARTGLVTSTHIGMQVRARVTHRASGNNCDINLTIVDGLAPVLQLSDTTVSIIQNLLPQEFGGTFQGPTIEDCSSTTAFYTDSIVQQGCNSSAYAKTYRTWTVTDAFGNSRVANQEITQVAVSLDSISAPRDTLVSCAAGVPTGIEMGFPRLVFGGHEYELPSLAGNQANLFWSYTDESFNGGGGTAQLLRSFRFFDACSPAVNGQNPRTWVQRISVVDTVAPLISTLLDTIYYTTSTSDCEAFINLPSLSITDNCTSVPSVRVQLNNQLLSSNGGVYGQLPLGSYSAVYTATDFSNNSSTYSVVVIVRDQNPPVLITKSEVQVSLPSNGEAVVNPFNFDQGSFDDCTSIRWSIRRVAEVSWRTELIVDCEDIGQPVNVEIRACDQYGNCNTRRSVVRTFDYLPPIISAPPNLTFACSVPDTNYALFGNVLIDDNCTFTASDSVVINRDQCGTGQMHRYWTATDPSGNSSTATQVISFGLVSSFSASDITWPQDHAQSICESLDPAQMPAGHGEPAWVAVACSNIASSYVDQPIVGPAGVCQVVFRTWTIIDQCVFDGLNTGVWQHTQLIELIDQDAPIITAATDTIVISTTPDSCSGSYFPRGVFDIQDCSEVQSTIKFQDSGQLVLALPYQDSMIFIPKGVTSAELFSIDDCGNKDSLSVAVRVIDQSPPVAICRDTLLYYLQTDSVISAIPLIDLGSLDACGEQLLSLESNFSLSCESLGWNTVELVATDSAGLQDVCFTEVHVLDTSSVCRLKSTTVFGRMATNNNHDIPTRFDLVGLAGDTVGTFESSADGVFSFDVAFADSVTIVPSSNYDPPLFVSTYDLYLIGQHILGITELTDPLKRFAADANRSRSISAFDMTLFRRLFLGLSDRLPHGQSVRFIPDTADLTLPDLELTPGIPLTSADQDSTLISWRAIKLGDVSGTRSFGAGNLDSRTQGALGLQWTQLSDVLWSLDYVDDKEVQLYGLGLHLNSNVVRVGARFAEGSLTAVTSSGLALSWLSGAVPLSLKQGASILTIESESRPRIDYIRSDAVVAEDEVSQAAPYKVAASYEDHPVLEEDGFSVYPNPARAGTLLRVSSEGNMISSLRLVNARGSVTELTTDVSRTASGFIPSSLTPGIYALQGRYADGQTFEQRILVSN